MIALCAQAFAGDASEPVEGFRAGRVAPGDEIGARVAFVEDPTGPFIAELTLRGQATFGAFGIGAEVVAGAGASGRWSDASLGNAALDLRAVFGHTVIHGVGLHVTLPMGWDASPPEWWGTVPTAMVPTVGAALFYEVAAGPIVGRLHVGFHGEAGDWLGVVTLLDFGAIVAGQTPLGRDWWFVGELEAGLEPSPLQLRALVRRDFPHLRVDIGLAAPFPSIVTDPTLQVVAQVARRW